MRSFKHFLLVCFLFIHASVLAEYGDMDPATCAPSGISNKLNEKMDPKGFWLRMQVESEMALQMHSKGHPESASPTTLEDCEIMFMRKPVEAQKCVWRIQNTINYWSKCNQHAKRMWQLTSRTSDDKR